MKIPMDFHEHDNRQSMKSYLARHALRVARDSGSDDAPFQIGVAAAGVVIVEARAVAERLLRARAEVAALEAMLRGLSGLTVADGAGGVAPFVTPREALDALANGPAIDAGKIAAG